MSTREILTRLAAVKAVKDALADVEKSVKDELMDLLDSGSRLPAVLPDGSEAGTVSIAHGRAAKWYVVDEAAFLAWVRANRPAAVVEAVRSSDQESILTGIATSGEIPDGVMEGAPGEPYVTVRQSPEQRLATVHAVTTNQLQLPFLFLPELEAHPEQPPAGHLDPDRPAAPYPPPPTER